MNRVGFKDGHRDRAGSRIRCFIETLWDLNTGIGAP